MNLSRKDLDNAIRIIHTYAEVDASLEEASQVLIKREKEQLLKSIFGTAITDLDYDIYTVASGLFKTDDDRKVAAKHIKHDRIKWVVMYRNRAIRKGLPIYRIDMHHGIE